jgi:predicted DNA-binding antitoxin AbrB/MazE fold protein
VFLGASYTLTRSIQAIQADAIYEGGDFRPLTPLELSERAMVSLSISPVTSDETEAARQRNVLLAYVSKVESRPDDTSQDGLSNRDHDWLIYGR